MTIKHLIRRKKKKMLENGEKNQRFKTVYIIILRVKELLIP